MKKINREHKFGTHLEADEVKQKKEIVRVGSETILKIMLSWPLKMVVLAYELWSQNLS